MTAERVVRNVLAKAGVQATRGLSLLFMVLAARVLGPADFGRFTFAYALATLLGAGLDLGMHAVVVREVARARGTTAAWWARGVTLKLGLLAVAGPLLVLVPVLTGRPLDTTLAVGLLGAAIGLQSFIELAVSIVTAFERLELELLLRVVEKLTLVAVGITGLALGGRLLLTAGAFTVAGAVSLLLAVGLVVRCLTPLGRGWDPPGARAFAALLGPVAVAFVLGFGATRLVPLLVALLAGDVAAGHFGAALRVLDAVAVVPVAVTAAVYPVLARTRPGDPQFRRLLVATVEALVLLGLPIAFGLGLGGTWLVAQVYGGAYGPTAGLLAGLSPVVCLTFLNFFLAAALLALDRVRALVAVALVGLGTSAVATPGLVGLFDAAGGAGALGLVEGAMLGTGLAALRPVVGFPFGAGALKGLLAAAIATLGAWLGPSGSGARLGVALGLYGVTVLCLRPFGAVSWGRVVETCWRACWPGGAPEPR